MSPIFGKESKVFFIIVILFESTSLHRSFVGQLKDLSTDHIADLLPFEKKTSSALCSKGLLPQVSPNYQTYTTGLPLSRL
jgi:hypothetical protein